MTANDLFGHFATLADAPGGIPKLRELILQMAIQGKVVRQDSKDEPAAELLDRIKGQQDRMIREKIIRAPKVPGSIASDEVPFSLPSGWQWVRLGNIGDWGSGATPTRGNPEYFGGSILWFKSGELNEGFISQSTETITEKALQDFSLRLDKPGDVLIAMYGATIGKVAILEVEATTNQAVCACTCFDGFYNRFLFLLLKAYKSVFISGSAGAAQPNFSKDKIIITVAPVPPLAEQKRIVAKVDRLMALCDALEAQQQARHAVRSRLHATLMGNLQTAANAADFGRAWQRLRDHFAELFTPGEAALDAVAKLRQTILHLAVQGKLVPQVSKDGTVSDLIGRIHEERVRLVESGKLKDAPPLEPIAENELLFSIPSSWQWVRAGDVCHGITSGTTPPQAVFQASPDSAIPYLKVYNIRNQRVDFEYKPQFIAEPYHRAKMKRSTLIPGDVIMNIVGPPLGKVAIIPDSFPEWNCNQAIVFFRLLGQVLPEYIHAYLMEGSYLRNIELIGTAGQDNISVTKSKNIVIPLPPLAEQQRIVAKVHQLMGQCGALEASLKAAATVSERWSAAAVRQLWTGARMSAAR